MTADVLDPPKSSGKGAVRQQLPPYQAQNTQKAPAPTLVLMAGFAGAGKTTLAKRLGYWLHWKILNKDELKLAHLAKGEREEQAGWHAFEELMQQIDELVIKQRKSVIVDTSNEWPFIFKNSQRAVDQLQAMQQINARIHVVLCKANKETRTERLQKRGSVFAPYVQKLPTILEDDELTDRFKHLPADKILVVDTRPPLNTYDWKVLKCLNIFREDI